MLFGYIILQFIWWEILLVKQTGQIIDGKQQLIELSTSNHDLIDTQVAELHNKKKMQVMMVVGEGTVFLLLLLFGLFKVRVAHTKEIELNQQQKNFLLSVTHELKTPIAVTKLQLQTLQKHTLSHEKQQELIQHALRETERLNSLIDNVLLANRLDSDEYFFRKEKKNVSHLINDLLKRYYKDSLDKNEIVVDIQNEIYLNVDDQIFPSIIINLIDNALKYSFQKKAISVALKEHKNKIVLTVADGGCGIHENERVKVFNKFYRAGSEETRATKGTGLGLYIVKYIVVNHHGKIFVTKNEPQGSIFEIHFDAKTI
ncbi:MAG: HAMP domain-containing histidine kinase [Bacteroidetes bacterium]|nr:HAMP domain-containing histidine kinase [Bacteroidota bacterium]